MYTAKEIAAMTDEQIADVNRQLQKEFARAIGKQILIKAAIIGAIHYAAKRYASK